MSTHKKILVAVNENSVLERIMDFACHMSRLLKAKLYIVYVFEVPRSLPLDAEIPEEVAKADKILDKAVLIAESLRLNAETDLVQARSAGPGIVDEAKDLEVDLIILGTTVSPKFGGNVFGSTVSYVLKKAHCEVLLLRQAGA